MKRCTFTILALATTLLGATGFGQAPVANNHLEPLRPLLGRWTGEVTLQQDMAGVARGGDKVAVTVHYRWTENKNAIVLSVSTQIQDKIINVTHGLIVWDAEQKKIVGMDAYVDGGIYRYEMQPREDGIVLHGRGVTADGAPTSSTIEYRELKRDGFVCQFINQREGDKDIPDGAPILLARVKTTQSDQFTAYEHLKGLEWMVGSMVGSYTIPEGWDELAPVGTKVVRRVSARWALNRSLLVADISTEIEGQPAFKSLEIAGWDPKSGQIVHWIFSAGGGSGSGVWAQEGGECVLNWTSTTPGGTIYTGVGRMRPTGPDTSEWRITDGTKNGEKIADIPSVLFKKQ